MFRPPGAKYADDCGKQRDKNNGGDDVMNTLIDVWNEGTERIPAQNHAPDPQDSTYHIKSKIPAVGHHGSSGYRRAERPNDRHKPRENNRSCAVLLIEKARAFQMALTKDQRIFSAIKRLSGFSANPITHLIPDDCTKGNEDEQLGKVQVPRVGKDTRGN